MATIKIFSSSSCQDRQFGIFNFFIGREISFKFYGKWTLFVLVQFNADGSEEFDYLLIMFKTCRDLKNSSYCYSNVCF